MGFISFVVFRRWFLPTSGLEILTKIGPFLVKHWFLNRLPAIPMTSRRIESAIQTDPQLFSTGWTERGPIDGSIFLNESPTKMTFHGNHSIPLSPFHSIPFLAGIRKIHYASLYVSGSSLPKGRVHKSAGMPFRVLFPTSPGS